MTRRCYTPVPDGVATNRASMLLPSVLYTRSRRGSHRKETAHSNSPQRCYTPVLRRGGHRCTRVPSSSAPPLLNPGPSITTPARGDHEDGGVDRVVVAHEEGDQEVQDEGPARARDRMGHTGMARTAAAAVAAAAAQEAP